MNGSLKKNIDFPVIILMLSAVLIGAFPVYVSCLLTVLSVICLLLLCRKGQGLRFRWNLTSAAILVMLFFYLISILWAVDRGEAWIGFLKYLPVGLFLLILFRKEQIREKFFSILPYFAAAMAVVSAVLMQFGALKPYFSVAGRLAGFFQYPNTFACFTLIAELVLCARVILTKEKGKYLIFDLVVIAVLAAAMVYSGSRTVLVLAFASNLVLLLYLENKKARVITVIIACLVAAAAVIFLLARQGADPDARGFAFAGSTLADRLLYYTDALPVILKHPFGTGHLGYFFLQGGFQTGVYSTMFVHNGFLQVFLDVGWIPGVLLIAAIVRSVVGKGLTVPEKIILVTCAVHVFFDFDLQYISMFLLLLLLMDSYAGKEKTSVIHKNGSKKKTAVKDQKNGKAGEGAIKVLLVLLGAVSLYMGISLFLSAIGLNKTAEAMYPWNTENELVLLSESRDPEEIRSTAEHILDYNQSAAAAWDSLAKTYYSEGDFGEVIACESEAIRLGQFNHDYYADYLQMLATGYQLYLQAGDENSAGICRDTLLNIYDRFLSQEDRLSGLGKIIKDQPDTALPTELTDAIKALQ